ncbi:CocE/NonD family hydrolase [Nocardia sp. NPDC004711]
MLEGVPVPMRDGAVLIADVYLPRTDSAVPVVLERTPYGRRQDRFTGFAGKVCDRGMAFMVQDVRGRGDSTGHFRFMMNPHHEGWDGIDTFEWVKSQDWCSGNIGTVGGSFSAANQQALALERPEGLKVQVLRDCGTNYYTRMFRQHGACNIGVILPWLASEAQLDYSVSKDPDALKALEEFRKDAATWIDDLPLKRGSRPFSLAPADSVPWSGGLRISR